MKQWLAVFSAVLAALLCGAAIIYAIQARRDQDQKDRAAALDALRTQVELARLTSKTLTEALTDSGKLDASSAKLALDAPSFFTFTLARPLPDGVNTTNLRSDFVSYYESAAALARRIGTEGKPWAEPSKATVEWADEMDKRLAALRR